MKTYKYFGVIVILAMLLALVPTGSISAAATKVDVCHYDKDADVFILINISDNAYDKHLAHGDVNPGDAIPGMLGMVYGDDCTPIRVFADVNGSWEGYSGLLGDLSFGFTMSLIQEGKIVSGTIYYPTISTTRSVTGAVDGFTLTITTFDGSYTATVSGGTTGTYFYGVGIGTPVTQKVALEAYKQ